MDALLPAPNYFFFRLTVMVISPTSPQPLQPAQDDPHEPLHPEHEEPLSRRWSLTMLRTQRKSTNATAKMHIT